MTIEERLRLERDAAGEKSDGLSLILFHALLYPSARNIYAAAKTFTDGVGPEKTSMPHNRRHVAAGELRGEE